MAMYRSILGSNSVETVHAVALNYTAGGNSSVATVTSGFTLGSYYYDFLLKNKERLSSDPFQDWGLMGKLVRSNI